MSPVGTPQLLLTLKRFWRDRRKLQLRVWKCVKSQANGVRKAKKQTEEWKETDGKEEVAKRGKEVAGEYQKQENKENDVGNEEEKKNKRGGLSGQGGRGEGEEMR